MASAPPETSEDREPGGTWLADAYGLAVLALCLACPWACWSLWGLWAGVGGILGAHVLYMLLLAPRRGICLGLPWILVFANGVLALVAAAAALVWRAIH